MDLRPPWWRLRPSFSVDLRAYSMGTHMEKTAPIARSPGSRDDLDPGPSSGYQKDVQHVQLPLERTNAALLRLTPNGRSTRPASCIDYPSSPPAYLTRAFNIPSLLRPLA